MNALRTLIPCLLVPVLFAGAALAQTAAAAPPASLPKDPSALMQLAWEQNGLHGPGVQPWHVRATWQIIDGKGRADGKPGDEGSWEEWWAGPNRSKRVYGPVASSGADGQPGQGAVGAATEAPEHWIDSFISDLVLSPVPSAKELVHDQLTGSRSKDRAVKLECVRVDSKPSAGYTLEMFCFAAGRLPLRIEDYPAMGITLNSIVQFEGRYLARDIRVYRVGMPGIEIHIDQIGPLDPAAEQKLLPASSATAGLVSVKSDVIAGARIGGDMPDYPSLAKQQHVQGVVSLWAIIGKDGAIHDLEVVGGPPMLQKSSVDAVKTWRYKPYLLGGTPVEVETQINVVYRLGS